MFNPEDDNTIVMYPLITLISHTEVLLNSGLGLVPWWCGPAVLSRCHRSPGHHLSPGHPHQPGGDKLLFSGVKWAVAVWQQWSPRAGTGSLHRRRGWSLVTGRCQAGEYADGQSSVGTDEGRSKGNKDLKVCFFSSSFVPFIILQNESSHPFNDSGQSSDLWHRHLHQLPTYYTFQLLL